MMTYEQMNTMFNHFGMGGPSTTLKELWKEGYVLVHYENKASFKKEEYENTPEDLSCLNSAINEDDAHLCLTRLANKHGGTTTRKLGVIPKEATPLIVGISEGAPNSPVVINDVKEAKSREDEFDKIYKGTKMRKEDLRELPGSDYFLWTYEPPFTSFTNWPAVKKQLPSLMAGEQLPPRAPRSYTSNQLELLCEEYLRLVKPSYRPLIDTGGSSGIHQVDLLGETTKHTLYGEVKNTQSEPNDTVKTLGEIKQEYPIEERTQVYTYLFTRTKPDVSDEGVSVISLQSVLETLWEHDRTRRIMTRMTANGFIN